MFHSLSSLQPIVLKRKKATSMALLYASPIRVEEPHKPAREYESMKNPLIKIREDTTTADSNTNIFEDQGFIRTVQTVSILDQDYSDI